jgi:bifunctional DNA-binding transcriptional regulator/antitoxin component of YhaV-PrlF toxin-antitoxin module
MKTYISNVLEICENGDAIVEIPDELMDEMGWKVGDELNITEENGNVIIKKEK